jgi:putative MFS transporter
VTLSALLRNSFWGATSIFWLLLIVAFLFADGGFAIVGPYAAEVWPAHLRATGMGAAYGFGGIGKIIGPLGLALIVGSSDVITPRASVDKLLPAFVYLAAWFAVAGITYGLWGIETKGRPIDVISKQLR